MKLPALFLSSFVFASSAIGNILVNPGLTGSPASGANVGTFGGDSLDIGGDGLLIDDGWVVETATHWTFSGGVATRGSANVFQYRAIAQMVSNPNNGDFDNGQDITVSFDYTFEAADPDSGFSFALWGVTAPNGTSATWNRFAGESVSLAVTEDPDMSGDETSGADYQFYRLSSLIDETSDAATVAFSDTFTLTRDYAFFAIAFSAERDDAAPININFSNPSLAAAVIPEPGVAGALAGLGALGLVLWRRRRC